MKRTFLFIIFIFSLNIVFPEDTTFMVVPFENKSDITNYKTSDNIKIIMYNSLYSFIRIIPNVNLLDNQSVGSVPAALSSNSISNEADVTVYGDYSLSGDPIEPLLALNLKIRVKDKIKEEQKVIFEKTYKSPTDIEIFDSIDRMIADVVKTVFKFNFIPRPLISMTSKPVI
jgi:hypothetical protein